jgi:hypothetical protein
VNRSIAEILTDDGVTIRKGKMVCPKCGKKKVTASASKGIAKCWGCDAFWSENGDATPASHDWASYIVSRVASVAQDELPNNQAALDWLAYCRGLPVSNTDWLADNDLGALSGDIDISSIGYKARGIWSEEKSYRQARVEAVRSEAADKKGEGPADAPRPSKCYGNRYRYGRVRTQPHNHTHSVPAQQERVAQRGRLRLPRC